MFKNFHEPEEEKMILPPTRADLAIGERLARRLLSKSSDQDVRKLAKSLLDFAHQSDQYVESLYPGFQLLEDEVRKNFCTLALESDGVWRLRKPDGKVCQSGKTLKDLMINVLLWDKETEAESFVNDCSQEEDEKFEPDRRKTQKADD